jgi:hypothetical protein
LFGTGAGIYGVYLLFIFLPALFLIAVTRKRILKMYELLPKDVIGSVYQRLKLQKDKKVRMKQVFPVQLKIALL